MARKSRDPYVNLGLGALSRLVALTAGQQNILLCLAKFLTPDNTIQLSPLRRQEVVAALGITDKTLRNALHGLTQTGLLMRQTTQDFFVTPDVLCHPEYRPENQEETALYRHYSGQDELLYVGISKSAPARLAQHMQGSTWAREIARVEVQHLPSRTAALMAEASAIKLEKPLWNVVHSERTIETSEI